MNKLLYLLLISVCWSCTPDFKTEKHQNKRNNVVNVGGKVKKIEIEDILIGQVARLYIINDYLLIADHKSTDKLIHIFDKNNYRYINSAAYRGQGPGEITNMGHLEADNASRIFYLSDHGKQTIFSYDIDSILEDSLYMPKVKMKIDKGQFPDRYQYINDSLSMGLIIEPIGMGDFKQSVARWNMNTGEIVPMKYEHPDIEKKRVNFAVSTKNNIYVECYSNHDLMTICNLNGDLKYNVYGPDWDSKKTKNNYYGKVVFCNDRILAAYSGKDKSSDEYYPTKFFIFDINRNYIQTLETGYRICDYCYDEKNNRIVMNLDDEIQFAYLDLNGLIE